MTGICAWATSMTSPSRIASVAGMRQAYEERRHGCAAAGDQGSARRARSAARSGVPSGSARRSSSPAALRTEIAEMVEGAAREGPEDRGVMARVARASSSSSGALSAQGTGPATCSTRATRRSHGATS